MKACKSEHTRQPVPSIWGWIVSLVFFNDANAKKFAFGCLPWAIWQLQVQGTQSEIAFNFHILSIYYVQDCLRNFKRSKIMYINVENDPEIRFLENIEQLKIFPDCLRNFKRSKIM